MPSIERDVSNERDFRNHSFSDGRLSVPMWDSADPDRCPPPLPVPPGSPSLQTKSGASANIQAAANKLSEKARESFGGSYASNPSPGSSPEKSLIKGAAHRRMQSAHATNGKDLKSYLDGMRSGSPERPHRGEAAEYYASSTSRPDTPTRTQPKPILGENTPPSATMRALQSMVIKDDPLTDMTNGRSSKTEAEVSAQLHKLTSIATGLQQEMQSLSRRSKDNAADLIGLKDAQKERDEDVKKTLRELMTSPSLMGPSASPSLGRSGNFGLGLLDNKAFSSSPTLPRATSHNSLFDTDRTGSPSPFSVEGAASVAMLEKIIREMVTKEGQERLLSTLSELMDKSSKMSSDAVTKVNDLKEFIKEQDKSRDRALAQSSRALIQSGGDAVLPADLKTLLNKIKESVAGNGGMTAEVKALIRELRGEILGMGRELGRKLDQFVGYSSQSREAEDPQVARQHIQNVVSQSMGELRDHMENRIQESARQSSALVQSRGETSNEDMYSIVKHALSEHGDAIVQSRDQPDFDKEEILTAVRSACENFKPEIELQQYGLEREEVLEVLKEGLADYRSTRDVDDAASVNKQEVFDAISEALSSAQLPSPTLDTHAIKAEMLASIRECLEDFKAGSPGNAVATLEDGGTRELINDAIRCGLAEHTDMTSRVMEISRDDLFDAVKAGLDGSAIPFGGFGEQVLQQLHELVDGMKAEFKQYSAANGRDTEQVLDAVKDGLEVLRGQIEMYCDRAQDVTGKDEIIDTVRSGLDNLRMDVQGYVQEGPTKGRQDLLDYIKSEFEHLHIVIGAQPLGSRDADGLMSDKSDIIAAIEGMRSEVGAAHGMGGSEVDSATLESVRDEISHLRNTLAPLLIKFSADGDKEEMLTTIKEAIAELPSQPGSGISTEVLEAIHGEFEKLQSSITRTGGNRADTEEMLDTIRLGLDDLRSHVDKKIENPEKHILNGEILDALNEGLDNLRGDVTKTLEKPVDMTVTYEILDTLKEGLADLRADMEKLSTGRARSTTPKGGEIVLADGAEVTRDIGDEAAASAGSMNATDMSKVELLLAQLQIKVEAMSSTIHDMPAAASPDVNSKEHLTGLETILREVQVAVLALSVKEKAEAENAVTKDDTDAIETLLRNTKAKIDEMGLPSATETLASREQLDAVEAVARVIKDTTDALITKLDESVATKADVAVVEVLAADLKSAMEELKEKVGESSEDEEVKRLTKADLDVLGVMCTEIKDTVTNMILPDIETLPEKADIEQLQGLVNDLRDGHERFRETYDKDIGVTAQAFDDQKKDTDEIIAAVTAIKGLVEEFKNQACDQEESQQATFDGINESLAGITEKVEGNPDVADDIKALAESLKTEFEKAHASMDAIKTDHGEHLTSGLDRQVEHKEAIITGLTEKIDTRMDDLVSKYQDAQKAADEKATAQEAALTSTKELADELKLSIDTLGTALAASTTGFNDAAEKLGADSSTVFNRVDDVYNKLDETQIGLKGEHQATRDEIVKAIDGVSGIRDDMLEHNPKILVSLQELHALVNQHYEHSQKTATENSASFKTHAEEVQSKITSLPRLMPEADETTTTARGFDDTALHEKLDKLVAREMTDPSVHEKLDKAIEGLSTNPHATLLEKLEAFTADSTSPTTQLERLDAIHAQVMATAAVMSAFVATQTSRITDEHTSREREAEELALLISRHETHKDDLEADISVLNTERAELRETVSALKDEKDALASDKARVTAEIHAMHAALAIRKEEMAAMEAKADALERRVVEGLMDQSRLALLGRSLASSTVSRGIKTPAASSVAASRSPKRKTRAPRDLRVHSGASTVSTATYASAAPSTVASTLSTAMDRVLTSTTGGANARKSIVPGEQGRRIMSLGQIHHNAAGRPSLARQSGAGMQLSASPRGVEALKRSQSVRTGVSVGPRKSSWSVGVAKRGFTPMGGIEDKENEMEESRPTSPGSGYEGESIYGDSMTGTEDSRRTSEMSGTSMGTVTASEVTEGGLGRADSLIASMIAGEVRERIAKGELEDDEDARTLDGEFGTVSNVGTIDDGGEDENAMVLAQPEKMAEKKEDGYEMDEEEQSEAGDQVMDLGTDMVLHSHGVAAMDYAGKGESRHDFATPADSGLGSDLPTAALGQDEFGGYFPLAQRADVGTN